MEYPCPEGGVHSVKLLVSDHTRACHERLLQHHKDSIRFGYRCFDRVLLNGLIQPFQQPERVITGTVHAGEGP